MDQTTVLLARSFTVVVGGLFSWSMIDLVVHDRLKYYLADNKFQPLVILGGFLLGVIVLLKLRAMALQGLGYTHAHDHGHDHDHGHSHDHGHGHDHTHEHEPGHTHEHTVSLWRFIVLAIPLMIILMGMAPRGLDASIYDTRMTKEQREAIEAIGAAGLPEGRPAHGQIVPVNAKELQEAAVDSSKRQFWEGVEKPIRARISGEFVPDGRFKDRYRLMRIKITCCAADATPVGVTVIGESSAGWKYGQWLEVVGPVSFAEVKDKTTGESQFYPIIHQQEVVETEAKVYLQ